MKRNLIKLLNLIASKIKTEEKSTLANLPNYYTDKKPYILEGRGVRNWAKKTNSEKREIIRNAYRETIEQAKRETIDLYEETETLNNFTARVNWHKSAIWGYNPTAETWAGWDTYGTASASGCGYDKLSASICSSLSDKAKRNLKSAIIKAYVKTGNPLPYGVSIWRGVSLSFGGCGEGTIRNILEYCGLNDYRYISGSMFDYIEANRPTNKK